MNRRERNALAQEAEGHANGSGHLATFLDASETAPSDVMTYGELQSLLAERRSLVNEMRHEPNKTAKAMLAVDIAVIDRKIAAGKATPVKPRDVVVGKSLPPVTLDDITEQYRKAGGK